MQRSRRRFLCDLGAMGQVGLVASVVGCSRSRGEILESPTTMADDRFADLRGACEGVPAITRDELEQRIERTHARMGELGLDALIVEAGHDMRWLGGPRWGRSERPLLLVVPRSSEPMLVGPAFEAGTLRSHAGELEPALHTWEEHEDPYALALARLREASGASTPRVVALGDDTRLFVVEGLRSHGAAIEWRSATPLLEPLRRRKSPAELALMRRANEVTKRCIQRASTSLREGVAEHEFAAEIVAAQQAAGLTECWVLALFGPNAAFPHGTPEGRRLSAGDLVLVDTGGFLHGYASDITRTFAFGEPREIDERRRKAWDTVRAAQSAALERIRPGVRCAEVDAAARAVIAAAGFDANYRHFTHRLGHGIGMQVHEAPYLVRDAEHLLEPGNTMSNEPGIYVPGEFGIRIEDIVAVSDDGCEVFGPLVGSLESPFG